MGGTGRRTPDRGAEGPRRLHEHHVAGFSEDHEVPSGNGLGGLGVGDLAESPSLRGELVHPGGQGQDVRTAHPRQPTGHPVPPRPEATAQRHPAIRSAPEASVKSDGGQPTRGGSPRRRANAAEDGSHPPAVAGHESVHGRRGPATGRRTAKEPARPGHRRQQVEERTDGGTAAPQAIALDQMERSESILLREPTEHPVRLR
jgi:hypothetical protein